MMDPLSQLTLVVELDGLPLRLELRIRSVFLQLSQLGHIQHPLVCFQVLGVEICKEWVGSHHPSSSGDSIGHVDKLGGEELIEVLEKSLLEQLGVEIRYSVDLVRSNNTQIRHSNLFRCRLFHQG